MDQKTSRDELALREFYSVALTKNLSFVEQISHLLKQGCEYLGMRCGIISYIEGERYTVLHVYTNSDQYKILSGDVFELGLTYCKLTLEHRGSIGFSHAAKTDIAKHPSYDALKLEAYLGAPIYLNEDIFGTVNFSSIDPRETDFSESEKYYVQLIAEWFSTQLEKHYLKQPALESYQDIASRLYNTTHAIIELSKDYQVIKWSDAATSVLGWEPTHVMHKSPDQWPGIDEEHLLALMRSLNELENKSDNGHAFYLKLIKNNGELICTEWFLSYIEDANSKEKIIRCHILDITERVHVEEDLLKKNARYLDLYENAPDMYLSLDQAGNIISANKLCYQTLGYSETKLIGKPYWNLILKSDVRHIRRLIDVAFMGDVNELEMEASLLTHANQIIRTHQKIRIIQAKKGLPRELRIIARDITKRQRGQENRLQHLQHQRDEISHEVKHRIKNSLQAVIGLLTMNMDMAPELKPILTNSIAQVNTISVVNDLILDSKQDIELLKLIKSLLTASSKLFGYQADLEVSNKSNSRVILAGDEVISISLIFTEILINAFKHHCENIYGQNYIKVFIRLRDSEALLQVTNSCSSMSKSKDSTHSGKSMIIGLLPPEGAELKFEHNENTYTVLLKLLDPVVIHEVT